MTAELIKTTGITLNGENITASMLVICGNS